MSRQPGAAVGLGLPSSLVRSLREIDPGFRDVEVDVAAHPLAEWAESGAMWLSGSRAGPPVAAPGSPALVVRRLLEHLTVRGAPRGGPGSALLGERAALAGLTRAGSLSCGGASRLLSASDGLVALSMPREDDLALVPALTEGASVGAGWTAVEPWVTQTPAGTVVERAQLLGLAAATVPVVGAAPDVQATHRGGRPVVVTEGGRRRAQPDRPLVVDLSSLWAGPLCAHLLGRLGARVVKVEGRNRPDGARRGVVPFFDLLHGGHDSVTVDLQSPAGSGQLSDLLARADIVIEGSRPRALAQLGIEPAQFVARGTLWLSITAYGRVGPWSNRVGFGDDVAAAAGMVGGDCLGPCFLGDALADPLTGAAAALCAALALSSEVGLLIDVSMRDVVASTVGPAWEHDVSRDSAGGWWVDIEEGRHRVRPPVARPAWRPAAPPGMNNAVWLGTR
jgi:hypothetical protein